MGRNKKEIDTGLLYDLMNMDLTLPEAAKELGISIPTLSRRIADIQTKQGLLVQYRALQSLQLTELQARVLEAITPEKIDEASLKELVGAFKILKEAEVDPKGNVDEVRGLLAHLLELEKQEFARKHPAEENIVEGETVEELENFSIPEDVGSGIH